MDSNCCNMPACLTMFKLRVETDSEYIQYTCTHTSILGNPRDEIPLITYTHVIVQAMRKLGSTSLLSCSSTYAICPRVSAYAARVKSLPNSKSPIQ